MTRADCRGIYESVYLKEPNYKSGQTRLIQTIKDMSALPCRGSYLDVGCGRRQMMIHAATLGFSPVIGIDVVPLGNVVAEAHMLPLRDKSFDVAVLFDVIEHLLPGDDFTVCKQLQRVARRHVLVSASNTPSVHSGRDLHINKRDYDEWHDCFRAWFDEGKVERLPGAHVSPMWRIDLLPK